MRHRKTTVVLSIALIMVWGWVTYRIVSFTGAGKPERVVEPGDVDTAALNELKYHLLLDYEDPFLGNIGEKEKKGVDNRERGSQRKIMVLAEKPVNDLRKADRLPDIQYKGIVRNHNRETGILFIHGKERLLQAGDVFDDVLIASLSFDKCIVKIGTREYTYRKIEE